MYNILLPYVCICPTVATYVPFFSYGLAMHVMV